MTNARACQRTIRHGFSLEGVGLHTGQPSAVHLSQSTINSGIAWLLSGEPAPFSSGTHAIRGTSRCTVLGTAKNQVSTVEHLLSALSGCAIDNCLIRVEGPEVPALDGSSLPFCVAVEQAGFLEQDEERQWFELDEPVWVEQNGSHLLAIPAEQLRVTYGIDFAHPVLGQQIFSAPVTRESYRQEIAPARTFGFLREIEELRRRGLALGGGMDNALVIAEDGYLSPLRFADEPVRHKVLDLLGDLALLGAPLRAHVIGLKTSHGLNVRLVEAIQNKRRRG